MPAPPEKEITSSDRIKRIFGILRLDGREIELHFPQYIEIVKIASTTYDSFTVKLSNPLIDITDEDVESVFINFIFSGVELFGKCKFLGQERSFITLGFPHVLSSRTRRRYPRVRIEERISADLRYKEFPQQRLEKIAIKDIPVKYSQLYWEAQRENADIKKVFLMALKELRGLSPLSEIVIYSKNTMKSRDARVMRKTGKVLYIDDCKHSQSYYRLITSEKITNYSDYLNDLKMTGVSQEELAQELQAIIREDLSRGCTSKVLVPIFSKSDVIGHLFLCQNDPAKKITTENITDLFALSTLLSLAIENSRFTTDLEDIVPSSLVDISEGGLLLKIQDHGNKLNLLEGTEIEVTFSSEGEEISLKGTIRRKDPQSQSYAIEFTELRPEIKRTLKKFIEDNIEKSSENP
ncbi:MAG: hypothetical protein AMS17_08120 [Spirochaetes bacterium DG_61]|nr:MAG: hypothetical protein AMS17_08120 [Spirochaetes bacterium DG_61]